MAVILANGIISYSYTKDEIMGPAGVFYGLAGFVAMAALVSTGWRAKSQRRRPPKERRW
jgi:hypothetical protein